MLKESIGIKLNFSKPVLAWTLICMFLLGLILGFGLYFIEKNSILQHKKIQYQYLSHQAYSNLKQSINALSLINSISNTSANINIDHEVEKIKRIYNIFGNNSWIVNIAVSDVLKVNEQYDVKLLRLIDQEFNRNTTEKELSLDNWQEIVRYSWYKPLSILQINHHETVHPTIVINYKNKFSQASSVITALLSLENWKSHSEQELPYWIEINYQPTTLWLEQPLELSSVINPSVASERLENGILVPVKELSSKLDTLVPSIGDQLIGRIVFQDIDLVFTSNFLLTKIKIPITDYVWFWAGLLLYLILMILTWLYIRGIVGEKDRLKIMVAEAAQQVKHSNSQVSQRNTHLAAIVNTSMDAIISASNEGIIESFNPAAERIFGWSSDEVIGKNLNMLMPEPYHSEHDSYLENYFATGIKKVIGSERKVKGKHKHGRIFDIKLSVLESFIDDRSVYIGYISDLSENEALKFELSTFFNLSIDLFCLVGFDGYFKQLNKSWTHRLGYEADELLLLSFDKLIHPDDMKASMDEVRKLADPNYKMVEFENRYLNKQGEYRWFCWNALPNINSDMVYVSGRDITEQKQQQIKMQLANERMALASDKLQELDGLKSMFIATMSHELRTPLNSIIGFSSILLQGLSGELNEKQQDHLRRVNNASKHLLSMITDIIDVSKIEAERFDSINEQFDVSDVVSDVVESIAEQAKQYGIAVNTETLDSVILTTDKRRIKQVILNLLSNAVKYSLKGEIKIFVKNVEQSIEISIQDQGIGISDIDLEELFMPFSRFERLKMERSGTGLGLYLTKKIVENILMGQIMVHSVVDEGSTFSIVIPKVRPWQDHKGSEYEETVNGVNYRG